MNKLIIAIVFISIISIVYILKFRETFISSKCSDVQIDSIDPTHPKCIEQCIDRYTWTDVNRPNTSRIIGELNDDGNYASLKTSNCFKCVRNFYHGLKLIKENKCN